MALSCRPTRKTRWSHTKCASCGGGTSQDVGIYERGGFQRTVARFANKDEAEEQLSMLQQYRKSAYVINLDAWWGEAQESGRTIAGAPVFVCR